MYRNRLRLCSVLTIFIFLSGCATFRSEIKGEFGAKAKKNYNAEKVNVLFIFSHFKQIKGYDAIPKLEKNRQIIDDFDDLFIDALNELTNIKSYSTFTKFASDVSNPQRRHTKDSLMTANDYVIRVKFLKESSFVKHFLGTLFSTVSVTLLPVGYSKDYSVTVDVYNHDDVLIKSYMRQASLTKWVESLLIFIYPFHTERRKQEEIYIAFMHDIFKQIETEKALLAQ
ncbi:hypothetical protein K9N50_10015 [bacterium]|nr:hypothetical protein [bacterium]